MYVPKRGRPILFTMKGTSCKLWYYSVSNIKFISWGGGYVASVLQVQWCVCRMQVPLRICPSANKGTTSIFTHAHTQTLKRWHYWGWWDFAGQAMTRWRSISKVQMAGWIGSGEPALCSGRRLTHELHTVRTHGTVPQPTGILGCGIGETALSLVEPRQSTLQRHSPTPAWPSQPAKDA